MFAALALLLGSAGMVRTAEAVTSDLVPQGITLGASTVAPGGTFTVSWTLANVGAAPADAASTTVVRINQSTTSAVAPNLASVATPALAAGTSVAQSATLTAPNTPGTYYVWILADDFSAVSNQGTNTGNDLQHSGALTVQVAGNSDLVPQGITLGASTVAPGATFTVSWTLASPGD